MYHAHFIYYDWTRLLSSASFLLMDAIQSSICDKSPWPHGAIGTRLMSLLRR